ncbi:MAG: PEP-CTERM sorting domain-containing protein [Phycisphaerae bacterium]|jgi:hypothetical protein
MSKIRTLIICVASLVCAAGTALANVIGFDDFDGNGNYLTRLFDPDNSDTNGEFSTDNNDFFGVVDRTATNSFMADDTSSGGTRGLLKPAKTDHVFGVCDVWNADHASRDATAEWTFDITGAADLSVDIDFAVHGVFLTNGHNNYTFTWSIDAGNGGTGTLFATTFDSDVTSWTYTYEDGSTYTYDVDNALDPILINGTHLDNTYQTLSAPIAGTGSTLTVALDVASNGGNETIFSFDNLVVNGVPEPASVSLLVLGALAMMRRHRGA